MQLNDSSELKEFIQPGWNAFSQAFGPEISVQPNPVHSWAAFNYKIPDKGLLPIFNAESKCVHEVALNQNQGQYVWDTRQVKAGIYIYTIQANGISKSGKLIVR